MAKYQYLNKLYELADLAKLAGVKPQTMYKRTLRMTVKEAVECQKRKHKEIPAGTKIGVRVVLKQLPNTDKGVHVYQMLCECGLVCESRADVINNGQHPYSRCLHKKPEKKKVPRSTNGDVDWDSFLSWTPWLDRIAPYPVEFKK